MLARLCFDNLLLIDELLADILKKYEIATKRKKNLTKQF